MKRNTIATVLAAVFSLAATATQAGECPADQRVADGQGQKMVTHGAKDVADTVVVTTDLSNEQVALKDHLFRARRLVIKPGGIVPWHSHDARPAMIYIVSGEIIEYASNCAVPTVHKAGDAGGEGRAPPHGGKNTERQTVELIGVDISPPQMKKEEHMM